MTSVGRVDVAVVGGGPAGAVTALLLARAGRDVALYAPSRHEALRLDEAQRVHQKLRDALARTDHLAGGTPGELAALDVDAHRRKVNPLLQKASHLARAGTRVGPVARLDRLRAAVGTQDSRAHGRG